ncbi:S-adenosyl-L-methionine-dependent methyltransferase [Aspergillus granulosus]|uniref:S-adenosyl-L-methionine-dependent methyltransferase n=1 Tax=Aspergillus granulosus TaxID=176169 RepID=A0ABR4HVE7_9EURO
MGSQQPFTDSNFDWVSYNTFRPSYPSVLFKHIFDYHNRHAPVSETILDLGCGPGTCTPYLLERDTVRLIISVDIGHNQLEIAKKAFISHPRVTDGLVELQFRLSRAEELAWLADSSIDIVVAAEAVHFFDHGPWFREVSRVLKPGGTLAFWFYQPAGVVQGNPAATNIVKSIFRLYYDAWAADCNNTDEAKVKRRATGIHGNSLLDTVSPPTDAFEDEMRVKWIPEGYVSCSPMLPIDRSSHTVGHITHQSEGMMEKSWNWESFQQYLETLAISHYADPEEERRLKQEFKDSVGGDEARFTMLWPLVLVLCRRKKE